MITGLHSRKKNSNQSEGIDPEVPELSLNVGVDDDEIKTHRRISFVRRLVRSEVGCAIEAVVAFLIFGLLLGYIILHHQQRKVRLPVMNEIRTAWS